jgi:hypothetical protein
LLENVAKNSDRAVASLKLLGQDREVSLWRSESQQGIIIVNASPDIFEKLLKDDPETE